MTESALPLEVVCIEALANIGGGWEGGVFDSEGLQDRSKSLPRAIPRLPRRISVSDPILDPLLAPQREPGHLTNH